MKKKLRLKGQLKFYIQWPIWLTSLLLIINIWIFIIDKKAGFAMSFFVVIYFAIALMLYLKNKSGLMKELIKFATEYAQVQRRLLYEFELPYGILDEQGKILWINGKFSEILHKESLPKRLITSYFPEVKKSFFSSEEEEMTVDTSYEGRSYSILLKKLGIGELMESTSLIEYPDEGVSLTVFYMFDDTDLKHYMKENQDQKLISGLIYIDNYEEALESIENVRRSLLVALIDRKINKFFADIDGIVRKIEKDKYFVVLKHKYLSQIQENKFSLLEEVKNVSIGNEMAVTISIGLGVNADSYTLAGEYARTAIDLALGRGGDQAVVKDRESIYYYGGKSKQIEKNTRVKARVKAHALRELLENNDKVVIMGHKIGDVDSFGASIGIYRAAKSLGKRSYIVINEITTSVKPIIDGFIDNPEYEEDMFVKVTEALEKIDNTTVVIVVDVNRPSYTESEEILNKAKTVVVLDHHRQSSEVIEKAVLSYIEPYASSASEMVAEVLQYIGDNVKMKSIEADALYAGIIIDTNNFLNKTGVRTFEAAAFLKRNGADLTRVRKMFREDMADYRAKVETIHNAEIFEEAFAIAVCPGEELESPTIVAAQAANELLNIEGIKGSFVITEFNNKVYLSARSIDEVNVQLLMEQLGGGGHLSVAGAQFEDYSIEKVKTLLKETLKRMIAEGDI